MKNALSSLSRTLEEFGLSQPEAAVYLALLQIGPTTILNIARNTNLKRTTIYSLIDALKQKGLVTVIVTGLKQTYAAQDPSKLQSLWQNKLEQFNEQLPTFQALQKFSDSQAMIKYYEGKTNIREVYLRLIADIKPHEDYLIVAAQEEWYKSDPHFFQKFIEKRAKLPINIRLLAQDSPTARQHKKFEKNYHEAIKFLPKGTAITTNLVITPQRVVIHQLHAPHLAIVIENQSVIQMHREQFEIMWRAL